MAPPLGMQWGQKHCNVADCGRPHDSYGFCKRHAMRLLQNGHPLAGGVERDHRSPAERFLSNFTIGEAAECWEWRGNLRREGNAFYGRTTVGGGQTVRAHRFSYEYFVGPIPEGLVIDHLCENTRCVNPAHLEPVTNSENSKRRCQRHPETLIPRRK